MKKFLLLNVVLLIVFPGVCLSFGGPDYLPDRPRPRVWLTDDFQAYLRAKAHVDENGNSTGGEPETEYTTFINQMTPYRLDYSGYYKPQAWHFALAFLMTKDKEYLDRAIEIANDVIADMTDEIYDSALYAYESAADIALVYDWLYDKLTTEQKNNYKLYMVDWLDLIWNTSNANYKAWAKNDVLNNYYWHHMAGTALIITSLYGDDSSILSLEVDTKTYNDMMSFWNAKITQAHERLDVIGVGGGWQECHSYGQSATEPMMWAFWAMKTASGKDLFREFDYIDDITDYYIYAEQNDNKSYFPLGDLTRDPKGEANRFSRVIRQWLSFVHEGTTDSEYMQYWTENNYTLLKGTYIVPFNFFLRDESRTATNHQTANLPKGYTASGVGFFGWRSAWNDTDAVNLMFNSGQSLGGHQHPEHNGFTLWAYGEYLVSDANLYDSSGIRQDGELTNTYIVGGVQQFLDNRESYDPNFSEGILRSGFSSSFGYVKGDATSKYTDNERYNGNSIIDAFYRSIIQTDTYTFIYDKISPKTASNTVDYYLHTRNDPSINGDVVTITNGDARAFHTTVLPSSKTISKGADSTINSSCSGYYLKITPSAQLNNHYLLNVIEVASSTKVIPDSVTAISGTNVAGAEVGGTVALFSSTQTGNISSAIYTVDATTHYIADLPLNTGVIIRRNGTEIADSPFNSGSSGIISFKTNAGSANYNLTTDSNVIPSINLDPPTGVIIVQDSE